MLTVDLKSLQKQVGPAIKYLTSRLDEPLTVKGNQVQLKRAKARAVKLLLNKFLHQIAKEDCRVIIVNPALVKVLGPEKLKPHRPSDMPNPRGNNETIPYYQARKGVVPKPWARRKWRP